MQNAMILTMRKKYKTKAGHKVNLLALNVANPRYPVRFEYLSKGGTWFECYCTKDGKYFDNGNESGYDLVEDTTMQIEIGKKYKMKDGNEVKLYEIVSGQRHCVIGSFRTHPDSEWVPERWTINGFYYSDQNPCDCDLVEIEEIDWSKVPVDTKLRLTGLSPRTSIKRYFAGVVDKNKIKVFCDGATSWSAFGTINFDLTSWDVEIIND